MIPSRVGSETYPGAAGEGAIGIDGDLRHAEVIVVDHRDRPRIDDGEPLDLFGRVVTGRIEVDVEHFLHRADAVGDQFGDGQLID